MKYVFRLEQIVRKRCGNQVRMKRLHANEKLVKIFTNQQVNRIVADTRLANQLAIREIDRVHDNHGNDPKHVNAQTDDVSDDRRD